MFFFCILDKPNPIAIFMIIADLMPWFSTFQIIDFINELAASYPNLVTVSSIGKTYESRDMYMMKISSGGSGKNAIFIDGGLYNQTLNNNPIETYGELSGSPNDRHSRP